MTIALGVLAERTGLTASTQAMVLLRQALDRTMSTDVVQTRYRAHKAQRNHATWAMDTTTEHAVEVTAALYGPATAEEVAHCGDQEASGGPVKAAPAPGSKKVPGTPHGASEGQDVARAAGDGEAEQW
jgi:hypothetical protein